MPPTVRELDDLFSRALNLGPVRNPWELETGVPYGYLDDYQATLPPLWWCGRA